jgi:hypothetical protein
VDGNIDLERKVISMPNKFSIKEMLGQPHEATEERKSVSPPPPANGQANTELAKEPLPSLDDVPLLPGPGEKYKAFSRQENKPIPGVVLLLADASAMGFSYADLHTFNLLASPHPGQGPVIALRFSGNPGAEVEISGRNLDRLYVYLGGHRVAWIRVQPPEREFLPEEETVITGIRIKKLED